MKRKIVFIVLIMLAVLLVLFGCKRSKEEDTSDSINVPTEPIVVYENGENPYSIVYGDDADKKIVEAAVGLRASFKEAGAEPELCDEFMFSSRNGELAIYVGETLDDVSIRLFGEMKYDDFVVHVENNNIYLTGGCADATVKAVEYFISTYLEAKPERLELDGDLDLRYTHEYSLADLSVGDTPISNYKIVYDHTRAYSQANAENLRALIIEQSGEALEVVADNKCENSEFEILVGVTERVESAAAVKSFKAPNVYYSTSVNGTKLLITSQGVRTDEAALATVRRQLRKLTAEECSINSDNFSYSGNILLTMDSSGAETRPSGTDIRVMQSNILVNTSSDNDNGLTDQQRAELLADTYLAYMPDIITFNEMIVGRNITGILKSLIGDYYTFTSAEYLELFEAPTKPDSNFQKKNYATPIAYRNGSGLKEVESGFNYLSDGVSYHGAAWTVFEDADRNRFLTMSVHLSENKKTVGDEKQWITTYAEDVISILNTARNKYGDLPVLMGGDWFFWDGSSPYELITDNGFSDAAFIAQTKHSDAIGTYHTIGSGTTQGAHEDIIFVNSEWIEVLSHKILVDYYTVNGSDHYPVMVDVSFKKSSAADELPDFSDGSGDLEIEDSGAGGVGRWEE